MTAVLHVFDSNLWPGKNVQVSNTGIEIDSGGTLLPELLEFDVSNFNNTMWFTAQHLQRFADFFFRDLYCCGNMLSFTSSGGLAIEVKDADSHYNSSRLRLNKCIANPLIFIQEIIHAALGRINPRYNSFRVEDTNSEHFCSQLLVTSNSSPGIYLDARFRVIMQLESLPFQADINFGYDYLPYQIPFRNDIYPSLSQYCKDWIDSLDVRKSQPEQSLDQAQNLLVGSSVNKDLMAQKFAADYRFMTKHCKYILDRFKTEQQYVEENIKFLSFTK